MKIKKCEICGKEFDARSNRQKTCGPECRKIHNKEYAHQSYCRKPKNKAAKTREKRIAENRKKLAQEVAEARFLGIDDATYMQHKIDGTLYELKRKKFLEISARIADGIETEVSWIGGAHGARHNLTGNPMQKITDYECMR